MIYLLVVSIRFLHEEKIYTRTLGSAGDLTIYAVRHGTLFCARHLGAGDNLRTTLAAASIRPTFVGWASVLRCQLLRECYFLDSIALRVRFLDVCRLQRWRNPGINSWDYAAGTAGPAFTFRYSFGCRMRGWAHLDGN
jgi:hypothetical protein